MLEKIGAGPPKVSYWKPFSSIRQIIFFPTENISLLSVKLLHVVHDEYLHFGGEINALYIVECLIRLCFGVVSPTGENAIREEDSQRSPLLYGV